MSVKELKRLIKNNDKDGFINFVNKNKLIEKGYKDLCPNYEDYYILEDLLRNANKSMALLCIDAGFRLFTENVDRASESLMHLAVVLGSSDIVQSLIDKKAPINVKNNNQETPLILAAICQNKRITSMLLSCVESKNCSSNESFSHFHIASMQNKVDKVKNFLVFGTDVNQCVKQDSLYNPGFTALHFAVQACSIETIELLVNSGADITIQDKRGLTPLHLAFRMRNKQMIDLLLSVQCYFMSNPVDPTNLSHFHIACAMNNVEIVKDFVEKQVKVDHKTPYEAHNWSSSTALSFAMENQCVDVIKYLVSIDGVIDWTNVNNMLILAYKIGNEEILNLLKYKVEKDIVYAECNNAIREISNQHADKKPESASNDVKSFKRIKLSQYTDLHISVLQEKHDETIYILENYPPCILVMQDVRRKTPLHLAFEKNQKKIVKKMVNLHLGPTENPCDNNGLSHFHISCTISNPAVVEAFLKRDVGINVPVKIDSPYYAGWTPLHFAVASENLQVVKLLLTNGADYTIENSAGLSSFDLAIPTDTKFLFRDSSDGVDEWEIVEKILLADKYWKRSNFNSRGISLLHVACATDDHHAVRRLASTDKLNQTIDIDVRIWGGFTPLHIAAHYDNQELVTVLLDHNADTAIQSACTRTAAACVFDDEKYDDDRLLLSSKNVCDSDGFSQFHLACMRSITAVCHFLKLGVDINKPLNFNGGDAHAGKTPLHLAVSRNKPEIVKILLENGANIYARDCTLSTPLHDCANLTALHLLINHGADIYARNASLQGALASTLQWCKDADFINAVFEYGLDVNEVDRYRIGHFYAADRMKESGLLLAVKYIKRLLVLGMKLNLRTLEDIVKMKMRLQYLFSDFEFTRKCREELERMKKIPVDNFTSLYDLLFKDSSEIVAYSHNDIVKKIIQSEIDLKETYPIYSYLLILQFKRGLERTHLLHKGQKSLSTLLNVSNVDVLHLILQFFHNRELKYLNEAVKYLD